MRKARWLEESLDRQGQQFGIALRTCLEMVIWETSVLMLDRTSRWRCRIENLASVDIEHIAEKAEKAGSVSGIKAYPYCPRELSRNFSQPETAFEMRIMNQGQSRWKPLILCIIASLTFSLSIGWIAVDLSEQYYADHPYHYDSAAYRQRAIVTHYLSTSRGLAPTLVRALGYKDGLDETIRLLLTPDALTHPYGHMVVLLPFLTLFLFTLMWFIFRRTNSVLLGIAVAALLFVFPLMYAPFRGIADFWKDNLATWLLGSAAVTWLLSDQLSHWKWAALCSFLLGLLVMQRTSVAVYAAMLFGPLFVIAVVQRFRQDSAKRALLKTAAFVAPGLLISGSVALLQWDTLYRYYFVAGYAYGTPMQVANNLSAQLFKYLGNSPIAIVAFLCISVLFCTTWDRRQLSDVLTTSWIALGFPALVVLTSTMFHSVTAIWMVLITVMLASAVPRKLSTHRTAVFSLLAITTAFGWSLYNYSNAVDWSRKSSIYGPAYLKLHDKLFDIISGQKQPYPYAFVFSAISGPFQNYAMFKRGIRLSAPIISHTIHDSLYVSRFSNMTPQDIAERQIAKLEKHMGATVVTLCAPQTFRTKSLYLRTGKNVAAEVATTISHYLYNSPHWRGIDRLESPYGCLLAYRFSPDAMNDEEKWKDLNVTAEGTYVSPGIELLAYMTRYPKANYEGIDYQWLPSGADALQLALLSAAEQRITVQAFARAGPSRNDLTRTLVTVVNKRARQRQSIETSQELRISIELRQGLNLIDFFVEEAANVDNATKTGDSRELMLLLKGLRFAPACSTNPSDPDSVSEPDGSGPDCP